MPVDDFRDCEAAVPQIRLEYTNIPREVEEQNEADYPRGCYVYVDEGYEGIVFNHHASGKSNSYSRQVCMVAVKGTFSNALNMK